MKHFTLFATSSLALGAGTISCWAQGAGDQDIRGPWHMMHDWSWGGGGMFFGPLFFIFWLAILVAVVVLVLRYMGVMPGGGGLGGSAAPTARQILDERYARGEIDQEEYETRRKTLGV